MFRSLIRLTAFVCIPIAAFVACGDSVLLGQAQPPAPELFVSPDASTEAAAPRELTNYCASNKCPTGFTTCPTSKFLCDVDLRSDRDHCGACGAACPAPTGSETYSCIEGRCVMQCKETFYRDCDGLVDTGCETLITTDDNCGACGNKCSGTTCNSETGTTPSCGCADPYIYCNPASPGAPVCHDVMDENDNCGACGNTCDPAGDPGAPPAPPNAHYGCVLGQCNRLKCNDNYGDCNADLHKPGSDGCEVALRTHENCAKCGDNCTADGMLCAIDWQKGFSLACRCPPGTNFCGFDLGTLAFGLCADFSSDPSNCGACGRGCPGTSVRSKGVCESGTCKLECGLRWADCNGNVDDDCEVDIFSDPHNCGGCGITCDIAGGQACAGGRCVVEPCKEEEAVSR